MLQSTLNSIRGLKEVGFRSYEIYGLGVAFPHYWNNLEPGKQNEVVDIYQRIFEHKIEIKSNEIHFIESKEYIENNKSNIMNPTGYLNIDNYTYINEKQVSSVFKSFEQYTGQLDKDRRANGRIRTTPNNPESSRSIVVYDFVLLVEEEYVSFTIIDLPGREEITQSYVETYLQRKYKDTNNQEQNIIPTDYHTPFYKALLSSIAINPIAMALLVPSVIFETINEIKKNTSHPINNIFNNEFFTKNRIGITLNNSSSSNNSGNTLGSLFGQNVTNYKFDLNSNPHCSNNCNLPNGQNNIIKINPSYDNPNQISKTTNTIQYQATVAIFVIDALIINKQFDVLFKIYKNIIDKYVSMTNFKSRFPTDGDKLEFLKSIYEQDKIDKIQMDNEKNINFYFDEIVDFQYFEAQHEGIYINQNIMGLLKYLITNFIDDGANKAREIIKLQPAGLTFQTQKNNYRMINFKLYADANQNNPQNPSVRSRINQTNIVNTTNTPTNNLFEPYEPYENISRSIKIMNDLYTNAKGNTVEFDINTAEGTNKIILDAYASDKYFEAQGSVKVPFMGQVVDVYKGERQVKNKNIKPITNIKIFYLFSNTQMELKCNHQANLLVNTLNLINAIKN